MNGEKMLRRSQIRENIFKLLFCKEFHEVEDMDNQFELYLNDVEKLLGEEETVFLMDKEVITEKEKNEIIDKVNAVIAKTAMIDDKLNEASVGWKTNRMGKVELTILRLAYYEMMFDDDVPKKVAIDEAVELAKKYGSDMAPSFVNGVLAKVYVEE
ncbi:MAG: transcription antitermination factor NusB [Lachnospiraceae bacterium]|nr:transcription antitermination factor NusB [Lachnospiraceae bacterium]